MAAPAARRWSSRGAPLLPLAMLALASWLVPAATPHFLAAVLLAAALRALARPLAAQCRLPERAGLLLAVAAFGFGAALGAWVDALPLSGS